jgi:hypothetical protein
LWSEVHKLEGVLPADAHRELLDRASEVKRRLNELRARVMGK